jgi:threonyl-tRNA synthetase
MPKITLPDGSVREYPNAVTGLDVAASIGQRLAKDALGVVVDGELRDLSFVIDHDAKVAIVTPKNRDGTVNKDALFLMRHSAAHVMAEAIQDVLGKDVLLAYGPPTDTGFFYDMYVPEGKKFSSDHFEKINARMAEIIKEDRKFTRYEETINAAMPRLRFTSTADNRCNEYKVHNALKAAEAWTRENGIVDAASETTELVSKLETFKYSQKAPVSFYSTGTPGQHWEDLCRGPHVPSTGRIGAVKVMSLASSYWLSEESTNDRHRLTRVYGTAFGSQAELDAYLNQLDEAKKRDHRVIGKQQHLFVIDEMVGQGLVLWTPNGSVVRRELQQFIGAELRKQGYTEVFTPHIGSLDLYKTSGHYPYYKDSQFAPIIERNALEELSKSGCTCAEMINRVEGVAARLAAGINERTKSTAIAADRVMADDKLIEGFMLKPMNCPHHARIFASRAHSYRDMPIRLAEFGTVYRWEQSGELNGMTRVRGFTQDDAHLFCTEDQVDAEVQGCLSLVKTIFATLGMKEYRVRVGLRDPDSAKYIGTKESWDKAEGACIVAAKSLGVQFSQEPGEAAFYGPKIDFVVKDVIGREWQLGTVQIDYQMALRFDLSYIGPDNTPHRPVVIHRAPFGSMERFCGVLIEHFAGNFPLWLSPEQVRVLPISDKTNDYAIEVVNMLKARGLRATVDTANDRIQGKVKAAADEKIPYLAVVGPRDAEQRQVSVRVRGLQKDAGAVALDEFVNTLAEEYTSKGVSTLASKFGVTLA